MTEAEMIEAMARAHWEADPYADERATWDQLDAVLERDLPIGANLKNDMRNRMRAALDAIREHVVIEEDKG